MRPPWLRIVVFIPIMTPISTSSPCLSTLINILLRSPRQSHISDCERRHDVKRLCSASPIRVEDRCVEGASERSLAVGGDGIGCDPFLGLRACLWKWLEMWLCGIVRLIRKYEDASSLDVWEHLVGAAG